MGAFKKEIAEFRLHVSRIKNQYTQLRYLKDNLPAHDVIIKMDSAEDYRFLKINKRYTQLLESRASHDPPSGFLLQRRWQVAS